MSTVQKSSGVRQRRFTKAEYYRMGELGFFHGQKVELIEGRLMVFSPQNAPHATAVYDTLVALMRLFGTGYIVRPQLPIDLGPHSEPEPDLVVVQGTSRQFSQAHPTSVELVVEVSDTTLSYDRKRKGSLYARAGIADYWIVNIPGRQLEVYRQPIADAGEPFGHRYSSRTDLQPSDSASPLALPGGTLQVSELLA